MESLKLFFRNFLQNKGQYVFVSLLIAKICAFLSSLFIIRLLPENEFGTFSIVASAFAIFAPFSGFGSVQSLLRFGSVTDNQVEKCQLSAYLFRKGFFNQVILTVIFLLVSLFYLQKFEHIFWIFLAFAVRLLGTYFFSHIQSELRMEGKNRAFAQNSNFVNIISLLLLLVLAYFFGWKGYAVAMAVSPYLSLFWFQKYNQFSFPVGFAFSPKQIWNYAFHASGTACLSDTLFSLDVLLLGFLMNETSVAHYKVGILLPANITFLALTFLQSDFPLIARNYQNKSYLLNYVSNYYKIFIPIVVLIFGVGYFFSSEILLFFFGTKYLDNVLIFTVLLAAFCLNILFRNLFGNMLSAVGMMKANTIVSSLAIVFLVVLSFILVPVYGILGMAFSMAGTLAFTGFLSMIFFVIYLRKLN